MSEVHAHRLISLHLRFHNCKSKRLLAAKPSVLYLLATSADFAKVERLASGARVSINGSLKCIDELTVKDAAKIKSCANYAVARSDKEMDDRCAKNLHRELATLLVRLEDVAHDIARYKAESRGIAEQRRIKKYLSNVIVCLKNTRQAL